MSPMSPTVSPMSPTVSPMSPTFEIIMCLRESYYESVGIGMCN